MTQTEAEALRQCDVTAAAWRLTLDAATGKQIPRDAATKTLIAAGADPYEAAALAAYALQITPDDEQASTELTNGQKIEGSAL